MKIKMLGSALLLSLSAFAMSAHAAPVCSVGDSGNVLWKGKWYPATVTRVNDTQSKCFIRYTGYGSEWDEWVGRDRFQKTGASYGGKTHGGFEVGDSVSVKWKGTWYPASVLKASNGKYKIHYDGYDSSWDEWVGNDRIRAR